MTTGAGRTMRRNSSRCLGLALTAFLGGSLRTHAQEPPGGSSIPVGLAPESRNEFWIDSNAAITFTLRAERRDLRLVFRDPEGLVWEIAAPASGNGPASPTIYETTIEGPRTGPWTLSAASEAPLPGYLSARLQITYANQVRPRMSMPRQTWVSGETLPVTLALVDGTAPVKNVRITVTVNQQDDPAALPAFVVFHDAGMLGDRVAKDGLYTALIPAEAPGVFHLEAQLEGTASTGRCHRTIDATFKIVPKAARITGNISQRLLVATPD